MASAVPVFCIAGPSAAGKTTLVAALEQWLKRRGVRALRLCCDDYYRQGWVPDPQYGYDTVAAIETDALRQELDAARARTLSDLRRYDMARRQVSRRPAPKTYDVILVEGAFGPQALLEHNLLNGLIYLDAALLRRLLRRLRRDVLLRRRSAWSVLRQMLVEMIPAERVFIIPLREAADWVVQDSSRACNTLGEWIVRSLRSDSNA